MKLGVNTFEAFLSADATAGRLEEFRGGMILAGETFLGLCDIFLADYS